MKRTPDIFPAECAEYRRGGIRKGGFLSLVFLLLALTVCLAGCSGPGNGYAEYRNLPSEGWRYGDTLVFTPVHPDSLCRGRIVIGVRHGNDYPYSALWLETVTEEGGRRLTDTLEIRLADRFGSWQGRGIGASFQMADTVGRSFVHRSGSKVRVRHIMRTDTLNGLSQVGVFFIEQKEGRD